MSEHGHHKENFFSKYVFSLDHKMISKQFLITGMIMGVVASGIHSISNFQGITHGPKCERLLIWVGEK